MSKTQNKLDKQRHEFDCLLLGLLNVQVPWIQHPLGKSLSGILNKVKINVWEFFIHLPKFWKWTLDNVCMIYKSADLLSFICSQEVWKLKLCRVHFRVESKSRGSPISTLNSSWKNLHQVCIQSKKLHACLLLPFKSVHGTC